MLQALSDNPEGESLNLCDGPFLSVAVREDARQLDHFC